MAHVSLLCLKIISPQTGIDLDSKYKNDSWPIAPTQAQRKAHFEPACPLALGFLNDTEGPRPLILFPGSAEAWHRDPSDCTLQAWRSENLEDGVL